MTPDSDTTVFTTDITISASNNTGIRLVRSTSSNTTMDMCMLCQMTLEGFDEQGNPLEAWSCMECSQHFHSDCVTQWSFEQWTQGRPNYLCPSCDSQEGFTSIPSPLPQSLAPQDFGLGLLSQCPICNDVIEEADEHKKCVTCDQYFHADCLRNLAREQRDQNLPFPPPCLNCQALNGYTQISLARFPPAISSLSPSLCPLCQFDIKGQAEEDAQRMAALCMIGNTLNRAQMFWRLIKELFLRNRVTRCNQCYRYFHVTCIFFWAEDQRRGFYPIFSEHPPCPVCGSQGYTPDLVCLPWPPPLTLASQMDPVDPCQICLEELEAGTEALLTSCRSCHRSFHTDCLRGWERSSLERGLPLPSCPNCRAQEGFVSTSETGWESRI